MLIVEGMRGGGKREEYGGLRRDSRGERTDREGGGEEEGRRESEVWKERGVGGKGLKDWKEGEEPAIDIKGERGGREWGEQS